MIRSLLFFQLLLPVVALCQHSYSLNDKVQNFSFTSTINNPAGFTSLNTLQSDIIIIDFFGTWCVPCVKALPHLKALQEKFSNKISILLVSNENKARLEKFVEARQPFPFLVVMDEGNAVTNLFTPPSYPYTVIINKERKIIALTDAAGLTEKKIEEWIRGEAVVTTATPQPDKPKVMTAVNLASNNKLVQLSQEFMYAAKTGDSTGHFEQLLKEVRYTDLKINLQSDEEKKAFWINLYNGFTQVLLKQNPDSYKNRGKFFSDKKIIIAGKEFSLDGIEHGILRRSKIKWSLGHLNKLFPGKTEKELRVNELDYRLHFALNCGAKSCPPIAFYNPENINPQLELATNAYLQSEAEYNAASNVLKLPAIMGWFRKDFGSKRKMIALVKEKKIIPQDANPKIKFKSYDWTLYTNNYKN